MWLYNINFYWLSGFVQISCGKKRSWSLREGTEERGRRNRCGSWYRSQLFHFFYKFSSIIIPGSPVYINVNVKAKLLNWCVMGALIINCRGGGGGGDTGTVWDRAAWIWPRCERSQEEAPGMGWFHDEVSSFPLFFFFFWVNYWILSEENWNVDSRISQLFICYTCYIFLNY